MKNILTTLFVFCTLTSFASNPTRHQLQLDWSDTAIPVMNPDGSLHYSYWNFRGAIFHPDQPTLPYYNYRFGVPSEGKINVEVLDAVYEPLEAEAGSLDQILSNQLVFETAVNLDRRQYAGSLTFVPIRRIPGGYEKLVSATLEIQHQAQATPYSIRGGDNTETSVLADGDIYRIAVTNTGMHKLTYDFLVNELGISSAVDPRRIQIFGNGGGMLPELIADFRYDDLQENAIFVSGEGDGQLNQGDYILFYGEGPGKWRYADSEGIFNYEMNVYSQKNYYFLKVGSEDGLRISSRSSTGGSFTSTVFNDYYRHEDESVNLLHDFPSGQGSGRQWFGDHFKIQRSYTYSDGFTFPGIRTDEEANIKVRVLGRTGIGGTNVQVSTGGQTFSVSNFLPTDLTDQDDPYATSRSLNENFQPNGSNLAVTVSYPQTAVETEGWVDYVQLNVRRNLNMTGDQMDFRDLESLDHPTTTFQLSGAGNDIEIWDITNPLVPVDQSFSLNGSTASFGVETDELKEFIAFRPEGDLFTPEALGALSNQNLHGITDADYVIVYNSVISDEVNRYADYRASNSDLSIELVRVDQIYNEFSSGKADPTAIRDFAKMLYDRDENFRYMLLFGDGSFDCRNLTGLGNNLIPTYQTENSLDPIVSFPSDDFFGLLSDDEGDDLDGFLDIAIGRFPVRDLEEAKIVVDKVIRYESSPASLGDWRNRMVFVGDDEDGGTHAGDADEIADDIAGHTPELNFDKIYVDAFNQISTPGGQRVPSATEALNQNMFRGILAVTYLGHGGPKGWAQERILQIPDINSWENADQLPVFITATCTFAGYDDPSFTSAGERTLLNERGGAIALYTTVRPVLSSQNATLTELVTDTLFAKVDGQAQRLGEVFRIAKNQISATSINHRKFTLLGDPTMRIALPRYTVATTTINGVDVTMNAPDTIRALEKVTVEGEVLDENGQLLENFNGILYPTVFDKAVSLNTLGQDGTPVKSYTLQKSVLFKGRASVVNGKFSFTFVVPKDINYEFGYGKISYYAADGQELDANGYYSGLTIGGTNPGGLADDTGPKVEVYMDSEDFVFGGITSEDPLLLVILEDDNGINVVGTSIGHDLTGVLDENTQNTYLLNDFYEAALDDYTRGEVRYPLNDIPEGRHGIEVKAFDVVNNSATGYTEFIVAGSGKVALEHVLNYPNPFVDNTCFQFEHNMAGQSLDVMIQIYTVSGRLVKTIQERISPTDSRLSLGDCIQWDGRDDYGDELARGVYVYKVRVRAADTGNLLLEGESDFEKLVILK